MIPIVNLKSANTTSGVIFLSLLYVESYYRNWPVHLLARDITSYLLREVSVRAQSVPVAIVDYRQHGTVAAVVASCLFGAL
jgi:hypothetical protein